MTRRIVALLAVAWCATSRAGEKPIVLDTATGAHKAVTSLSIPATFTTNAAVIDASRRSVSANTSRSP